MCFIIKLYLLFIFYYCFTLAYDPDNNSNNDQDITQYSTEEAPQAQGVFDYKNIFTKPPNITTINNVQLKVFCEIDTAFCVKVNQAFINAATQLTQVVLLQNTITFQASYYSFCIRHCSNYTYGWGVPSSQFNLLSLSTADDNFIYPQSLAKQLAQVTNSSHWASDYDVSIDINHDIYMNGIVDDSNWNGTGVPSIGGYYFRNDSSIYDNQVDIEYVILHQMVHGLGMISSWAPYFYDSASPFHLLLKNMVESEDSLKLITPNPYWTVHHDGGPVYISKFQYNLIFDRFLTLRYPETNITDALWEVGFDMQSFCVPEDEAFIVNFMETLLDNETMAEKAANMFTAMSTPQTLRFDFTNLTYPQSVFNKDPYLNQTYRYMQLYTGSNATLNKGDYYRPGIWHAHLDDAYIGTPDFLMTREYKLGKSLSSLVDDAYANISIKYNMTRPVNVTTTSFHNVTTVVNGTNHTVSVNSTLNKTMQQEVTLLYKSPIGPGVLRILEALGYSTVLTNTNYTAAVIKTNRTSGTCESDSNNVPTQSDDSTQMNSAMYSSNMNDAMSNIDLNMVLIHLCIMTITFIMF
ncbi:hypothetical protein G6F70_002691 [Rhizopus microsporus]|nr:hypothetical protein G6F71_001265 [Rhizopus microsporus]KAG1201929.1 hypothetical protein G6F70_002691 [Rhizopus microsporus]KAG1215988.1 hypothetical protein G6F69_000518 [Rhizopus microsporus]